MTIETKAEQINRFFCFEQNLTSFSNANFKCREHARLVEDKKMRIQLNNFQTMQQGCHNGNKKMVNKLTINESNSMIEQSLTMEDIVVTIDKLVTPF